MQRGGAGPARHPRFLGRLRRSFAASLVGVTAAAAVLTAVPALAQEGSIQVSSAAHITTGDEIRRAGQPTIAPDFAIMLRRPTTRTGTLFLDLHVTRRDEL